MRFDLPNSAREFAAVDLAKVYEIPLHEVEAAIVAAGVQPIRQFRLTYIFDGNATAAIIDQLEKSGAIQPGSRRNG